MRNHYIGYKEDVLSQDKFTFLLNYVKEMIQSMGGSDKICIFL